MKNLCPTYVANESFNKLEKEKRLNELSLFELCSKKTCISCWFNRLRCRFMIILSGRNAENYNCTFKQLLYLCNAPGGIMRFCDNRNYKISYRKNRSLSDFVSYVCLIYYFSKIYFSFLFADSGQHIRKKRFIYVLKTEEFL